MDILNEVKKNAGSQLCLRHALVNHQKYPESKIMMGPGLGRDTRHFWIVKSDGGIVDTTPGYDMYSFYSEGEVLDLEKNKNELDRLFLPLEK